MNKRQIDLLKQLIMEDTYKPIKYFSQRLNVSGKTVSKDLDELEEFVNSIGSSINRKQGLGICLKYKPSQLKHLNKILNSDQANNDASDLDLEQRRVEILLNLLMHNQYTTIQKLSDKYLVSRTSIINDLKYIQKKLDIYNLKISKTQKGTRIIGSELDIRKALVPVLQEYGKLNSDYIIEYQNLRHNELKITELKTLLNEKSISFFENLLNELEKSLKLVIYEPYYTNLITHLIIMTSRIINGNYIEDNKRASEVIGVENNELYSGAIYIIREIEKYFNIKTNKKELIYIYKYLISIGLSYDDKNKREINDNEIDLISSAYTKELIKCVSQLVGVNYTLRIGLYDKLMLHIKPMLNRLKYNIQIENPLLKDFLEEFKEQFYFMKVACYLICRKFNIKIIKDDEVAYVLSYFLSEYENISKSTKIKSLVVCHSGYGTSQLLTTRLEKAFHNIKVVDTIASNSINNVNLSEIDIIISTVKLDISKPYIITSVFLNEIDKENINNSIETILKKKKRSYFHCGKKDYTVEIQKFQKTVEECESDIAIHDKNLIHLNNRTYLYLTSGLKDSAKKSSITRDNLLVKNIYEIYYSNYKYLASILREIIKQEDL